MSDSDSESEPDVPGPGPGWAGPGPLTVQSFRVRVRTARTRSARPRGPGGSVRASESGTLAVPPGVRVTSHRLKFTMTAATKRRSFSPGPSFGPGPDHDSAVWVIPILSRGDHAAARQCLCRKSFSKRGRGGVTRCAPETQIFGWIGLLTNE